MGKKALKESKGVSFDAEVEDNSASSVDITKEKESLLGEIQSVRESNKAKRKRKRELAGQGADEDRQEERKRKKERKKKEKKKNKKKGGDDDDDGGDGSTKEGEGEGEVKKSARELALTYLEDWKGKGREGSTWKFAKVRQSWLLKHMYDRRQLPKAAFATLLEYLEGLQGGGRQATVAEAKHKIAVASDDPEERVAYKRAHRVLRVLDE
eukprot:TRINITY_DN4330_c0_g1_i5.p1 TRINITY_DN4330_c0_g1~~TRINITY_DN4330_c0_g1_i5.p1  ORF type:complete len:210 (+),score=61.77 TRINITY_DN4330_c0_g1_i5:180-809(+)